MCRSCLLAVLMVLAQGPVAVQQPAPPPVQNPPADQPNEKVVNHPIPTHQPEADFPDKARREKLNGTCAVSLTVDSNGMPQNVEIVRCTDPVFAEPSLDAVSRYRFKPATNADGNPIAEDVEVEVNYKLIGGHGSTIRIHYSRYTPPGITSPAPDSHGVYPYTKVVDPPTLTAFADEGYGDAAFAQTGNSACDLVLTIDQKGKPSDPDAAHCVKPGLERFVTQSLLSSRYKPGALNGKPVAVRLSIHLEFVGFFPAP